MNFLLRVAVPSPLVRWFDYASAHPVEIGCRVKIPFGSRTMIGLVVDHIAPNDSPVPADKIRAISEAIDTSPILSPQVIELGKWIANYYCAPPGNVLQLLLPKSLREGKALDQGGEKFWRVNTPQVQDLGRAKKQQAAYNQLLEAPVSHEELGTNFGTSTIRELQKKQLISAYFKPPVCPAPRGVQTFKALTQEQNDALSQLNKRWGFAATLLFGVTGSGKTEVYLQWASALLSKNLQVLVLIPEIGLTPQIVERFAKNMPYRVVSWHSDMTEDEKLNTWRWVKSGEAQLVIGTRSAVMLPFASLGGIVIDEEHDPSFKQQDGMKYSARDIAIKRAKHLDIPIILGSATPSMETLSNAASGKFSVVKLSQRATGAAMPNMGLIDCRAQPMHSGLAQENIEQIRRHLGRAEQVLIFQNRRGYAPIVMCQSCGWQANCQRCDAKLTLHRGIGKLRCHHCGHEQAIRPACPQCGSEELHSIGTGTEQLEHGLAELFPEIPLFRIDRDATRKKGSLEKILTKAHNTTPALLVGTQMIAKGHHFPSLNLVVVVDMDQGLFSADFRGPERMGQTLLQVAGRSGRETAGKVIIQTRQPEHPYFESLLANDYERYSTMLMESRKAAMMPPFSHMAAVKAYAHKKQDVLAFLDVLRQHLNPPPEVILMGPAPNLMERRAGYTRWQILLCSPLREPLHRLLKQCVRFAENAPQARKVRWSIDVDPQELL